MCVAALVAGAACGSVSNPNQNMNPNVDAAIDAPDSGDFGIGASTASLSMAITGKVDVMVDISRGEGFTDTVELSASGLPAGVTAAFALNSLPDATSSTTMTLTIDYAASVGTTEITITGTAGSKVHSTTVSLELHTSTVSGKVRYDIMNATVRIPGHAAVLSGAAGTFSFNDVKVPYDIYIQGQSGGNDAPVPTIVYYKGLTKLDPVITRSDTTCVTGCLSIFAGRSATISGARSGTGNNTDPLYAAFSTGEGEMVTDGSWGPFNATWFGFGTMNTTTSGTMNALQATRGTNNAPTGYNFGSTGYTLTNGQTRTDINVVMSALGTVAALTGSFAQPGGFSTPVITLSQTVGFKWFDIWTATTTSAASVIPVLTNEKTSLFVTSQSGGRVTSAAFPGLAAATDVTMTLPTPAGMTGPAAGATGVTNSTLFEYTTSPNQVYEVTFGDSTATYIVYTTASSITIPAVDELPLPGNTSYQWTVASYGPAADINASVGTDRLLPASKWESTGAPHTYTSNPQRNFTTQ